VAKTYRHLQMSRVIVAGLTLGLITVMFGVILDIALTGQRNTIATPTLKLIEPLNPQLDLSVVDRLERYEFVSFEQASEGVRTSRDQDAAQALIEVGLLEDEATDTTDDSFGGTPSEPTPEPTEQIEPTPEPLPTTPVNTPPPTEPTH
jgi:hypothetical protein